MIDRSTAWPPDRPALALILARGGSKGVPGKNRAPVAGRPCIAWTIDAAFSARLVGRVAVSSDDAAILDLAASMGAEVVRRPAELASDAARIDDVARHAAATLLPSDDPERRPIVILYANVPVRPAGLIDRAVARLIEGDADSVQSYAPVGKHHPWWTARLADADGRVTPWEGATLNHGVFRRQDLPPAYVPDGGVLVVTRRALEVRVPGVSPGPHAFLGLDRRGVATREGEVIDIDSPIDLMVADAALRAGGRSMAAAGTHRASAHEPRA